MTKEDAFLAKWHEERAAYLAWGQHVSSMISEALIPVVAPVSVGYFLKAAPAPRLKDDKKLIEKAFYRNKPYSDPYAEITDKVGIRFVVLLGTHVRIVTKVLEGLEGWTWSRDRDYEEEQNRNPVAFDYAAVHFVVRPDSDTLAGNILVPAGTPCEVQIKTILQHAYSELTHDTIYKPQIQATPSMQRNAAKAMALLEATNDYFELVATDVATALSSVRDITHELSTVYRDVIGLEPSPTLLEGLLLEAYESTAEGDYADRARAMLRERPFLIDRIKAKVAERNPIFSQPAVLLAYMDVVDLGKRALRRWPLTPTEMEPILSDLGQTIH
ncbi:RelA/SpoT domain-containing protein [Citromicrobium bathyomarinum]